jgi:hypothetical protein
MKRTGLLGLMALFSLTLACTLSFDLSRPAEEGLVNVEAAQAWTETEIVVRAGDLLRIDYVSGQWSPWPNSAYDAIGSGGDPKCRCNVMDGVSHAALIGRIGENPPFLVGAHFRRWVGESGPLFLGINDVDLYDNSGSITVEVQLERD